MISAYPNPFNTDLHIDLQGLMPGNSYALTLYDIRGRRIESFTIPAGQRSGYSLKWDAGHVASGIYMIECDKQIQKVLLLK